MAITKTPSPGANELREETIVHGLRFIKNADIPLMDGGLCRANIYLPLDAGRYPGIVTYGPYGKDIPYEHFHGASFSQIPDDQKSSLSSWETPEPTYWTKQGYAVIRIDERGIGSSPGFFDSMSNQTSSDFAECIEWCAEQEWCTGKVGLLGISYYGGSQWRVAARKPKGLACIIPWEGMSDYYRDRCRQGGIYSNQFIAFWSNNQVLPMQYGNANKQPRRFGKDHSKPGEPPKFLEGPPVGPECLEGTIEKEELQKLRNDQIVDNRNSRYLDQEYYKSRNYNLSDIEVPLLSVANLGGNTLHLRGNVVGYLEAGTRNKWLWFISGRHDLPFYLPHFVKVQKSFLDAWLKDDDRDGWKEGPNAKVPAVKILVRKGNPGFNSTEAEATFSFRDEHEWPLARTQYTKLHFQSKDLSLALEPQEEEDTLTIQALGRGDPIKFNYTFDKETEIAGHLLAHLTMGVEKRSDGTAPKDIDVFLTVRHFDKDGKQVFYTGTAGDPVPLCKGWLRASVRKINETDHRHRDWLPRRDYNSQEVSYLEPEKPYELLVEVWPTAFVAEAGAKLVFELATGDTQGAGIFLHHDPVDRNEEDFGGTNTIYFGKQYQNWLQLPLV